jgi:outer membrane protein TolC
MTPVFASESAKLNRSTSSVSASAANATDRIEEAAYGLVFVMKEGSAWLSILALALLLCTAGATPCAAQPQSQPSAAATVTTDPTPRAQGTATKAAPALNPVTRRGGQPLPSALPSAVSSDIERFVRQSGRDRPASIPPPRAAVNARAGQGVRDLPPALPAVPAQAGGTPGSSGPAAAPPSPLAIQLDLKAPLFEPTDVRFPINLATALRLSDARPLVVAAAQARVWVAEAELTQAKVLWLPSFNAAFDYIRHDGGGPDFNKGIMTAPSVNFAYGGVGLYGFLSLADAVYQPLVARQMLNSRQWNVQTAKNDALLQAAAAYFMVHQYRGIYAGSLYTVGRGRALVEQVASLSRDLVSAFEVDRARNMLADLEQQAVSARQQWRVQSAKLTRVLRLDPRAGVEPLEHDHVQITLINPARALDDLMPIALTNRPEIASRRALVYAAEVGVRREKARPFIPTAVLSGFQTPGGMLIQAGLFGLGPNSSLNQWVGREDFSVQFVWQLENFGLGNLAKIKAQRGQQSRAIIDLRNAQDMVAEEVNQSQARLQSAAVRVVQADRALRTGIITLNGATEGLAQTSRFGDVLVLITRPQEAIYALQLLNRAFDEYFTTVAEYNRAQFELFHALGYPANEVAHLRPTGEVAPVDTSRPSYLPPVGNGPPPATR